MVLALGILPILTLHCNSTINPILPALERLQKEEELGRQQISKYTRYLTFGWALILNTGIAIFFVKPVVFN